MSYTAAHALYHPSGQNHVDFDWMDAYTPNGDARFDYWEAVQDDDGHTWVYGSDAGLWVRYTSRGVQQELLDEIPEALLAEGPAMSGYWPLGSYFKQDESDAAWRVRHLPVCLVKVEDEYGLALTGGGMDLSWELAYAAILLDYLPWEGLHIYQGWGSATWSYGVHQIGRPAAARVRAALRYRNRYAIRRARAALNDLNEWK